MLSAPFATVRDVKFFVRGGGDNEQAYEALAKLFSVPTRPPGE